MTAPEPGIDRSPAIRDLRPDEAPLSAAIHREVLDMEFLSRFGAGFLSAYHRAWIRSPAGLALASTDPDGAVTGVMLGSLDPAAHYNWLLRQAGAGLAARMAAYALVHPALARELLATRGARYGRAIAVRVTAKARRALGAGRRTAPAEAPSIGAAEESRAGEITHLMVLPAGRGGGYGRALVEETERRAVAAGVAELVLVTPPDLDARQFYEHLGWETVGAMTSRSGEEFIRFRRSLAARPAEPAEPPDPA